MPKVGQKSFSGIVSAHLLANIFSVNLSKKVKSKIYIYIKFSFASVPNGLL